MLTFGSKVISLVLASPVQAAGGVLEGEVLLNLAELPKTPIEEIHVKFRGLVTTYVRRRSSFTFELSDPYTPRIDKFRSAMTIATSTSRSST